MVLGAWVLVRVAMWETPFAPDPQISPKIQPRLAATAATQEHSAGRRMVPDPLLLRTSRSSLQRPALEPLQRPTLAAGIARAPARQNTAKQTGIAGSPPAVPLATGGRGQERIADSRHAQADSELATGPIVPGAIHAPQAARDFAAIAPTRRWGADLWALWRDDTTTSITSGRPSYGRSQVGAVLRYRLAPASRHAPHLHLRATRALQGESESEVALGASARPVPSLPVRLAGEARVSDRAGGTELRYAAYAVSEFAPLALPAGFTGEAYVQGGYVSGDFATAFVDGQARISRDLAASNDFRLSAGAGAWGGAQHGAERLDIGPSAGIGFRIGQTFGRLSADYRFRVAGDAEPSSGPALTLSAGF